MVRKQEPASDVNEHIFGKVMMDARMGSFGL